RRPPADQGERPAGRHGDRAAQSRRHGRGGAGLAAHPGRLGGRRAAGRRRAYRSARRPPHRHEPGPRRSAPPRDPRHRPGRRRQVLSRVLAGSGAPRKPKVGEGLAPSREGGGERCRDIPAILRVLTAIGLLRAAIHLSGRAILCIRAGFLDITARFFCKTRDGLCLSPEILCFYLLACDGTGVKCRELPRCLDIILWCLCNARGFLCKTGEILCFLLGWAGWRGLSAARALSPDPSPVRPPRPHPERERGASAQPQKQQRRRRLLFVVLGGGALSRSGRGAVARAGEGRGGGGWREGAGFRDSALPPSRPGGGKPLPYFEPDGSSTSRSVAAFSTASRLYRNGK